MADTVLTREESRRSARECLAALYDGGEFTEIDRLAFGAESAAVCGYGLCGGSPVYAYSQCEGEGGAMGAGLGRKVTKLYSLAAKTGCPVVAMLRSSGANVGEGLDALNAYGEVIRASAAVSGVVPQIAVVLGDCVGSGAILAELADIVIAVKGAELCLSSAYLTGAEGESAERAAKSGAVALVAEDGSEAIGTAARLLSYLPENNLDLPGISDYTPAEGGEGVAALADAGSFTEFSPEYAKCAVTGFARVGGRPVGVVLTDREAKGGALCRNGARKISRFVRLCDAFSLPVVTLLDCDRFLVDKSEESAGGVRDFAVLAGSYAEATTAKITVITGAAYGAVYTCFAGEAAGCDAVFALEGSSIAALRPDTAVQFLMADRLDGANRAALESEYKAVSASPALAAGKGLVSDIITPGEMPARVLAALEMLESKRVSTLGKKHANLPF